MAVVQIGRQAADALRPRLRRVVALGGVAGQALAAKALPARITGRRATACVCHRRHTVVYRTRRAQLGDVGTVQIKRIETQFNIAPRQLNERLRPLLHNTAGVIGLIVASEFERALESARLALHWYQAAAVGRNDGSNAAACQLCCPSRERRSRVIFDDRHGSAADKIVQW